MNSYYQDLQCKTYSQIHLDGLLQKNNNLNTYTLIHIQTPAMDHTTDALPFSHGLLPRRIKLGPVFFFSGPIDSDVDSGASGGHPITVLTWEVARSIGVILTQVIEELGPHGIRLRVCREAVCI
jgi:hypothetical protein